MFPAISLVKSHKMLVVATTFGRLLFDAALIAVGEEVVGFVVWLAELHPTSPTAIANTAAFPSLQVLTGKLSNTISP